MAATITLSTPGPHSPEYTAEIATDLDRGARTSEEAAAGTGLALAADPGFMDRSDDPGGFVVATVGRAKILLEGALERGDIEQLAEYRSQAEAVRVYTVQKQLGRDAQLAATEIVRRAERGMGIAIRRGQETGEITRRAGHGGNQHCRAETDDSDFSAARPSDFASPGELTGNGAGIYHLADGVPGEVFEQALAEAKAEHNLSRANMVRKIRQRLPAARSQDATPGGPDRPAEAAGIAPGRRLDLIAELAATGMSSRQIAARLGTGDDTVRALAREHEITIPADVVLGRSRQHDPARIARKTTYELEGHAMSAELAMAAGLAGLDPADAAEWAASMDRSLRVLRRFARQIREAAQ